MPQREAVYVYGILPASGRGAVSTSGVTGADVRVVRCGGLAALVSDLEADALAAAREVRAHWHVLEAASDDGTTVLPVRFGTVMEGDRAVREQLLEPHEDDLVALLKDLEGRVQLSVKGEYDEERLMADVVRTSPSIAARRRRLRTLPPDASYYERIALGEMVAAEVERRRQDDAGLVLGRLEPLAVSTRSEPPAGANGAFNVAFLVERDRMAAFGRAVAKLGEELGDRVALRYIGPLPPYSFVDAELTAGSAGWA
jgi:Gas vesicle synthesis protein GvpL/GvpF